MIKYDKLWRIMREKGVTQYDLYTKHNVRRLLVERLQHNQNVEVFTLDKLCNILDCQIEDIVEHIKDDNVF